MKGSITPAGQLGQESKRDHALAGAWPASYHNDLLEVAFHSLVSGLYDHFIGQSLSVNEDELAAILDLRADHLEQQL
jgi:hypothetical protein